MRIYNPGLGKFLSVDPLSREFAWNSSYAFAENSPLASIDLEGLERYYAANGEYLGKYGTSLELRIVYDKEVAFARRALKNNPQYSGYLQFYLPSERMGSISLTNYAQNVNDVLNDAPLESYATHLNCKLAADAQMEKAGQLTLNKYHAIHTDVDNDIQPTNEKLSENKIGGAIYIITELKKGNPVLVGVMEIRESDGNVIDVGNLNRNTGHFVVISSLHKDSESISFGYYDNANSRKGKSSDNKFNLNINSGELKDTTNLGVLDVKSYTVSEVRKNKNDE